GMLNMTWRGEEMKLFNTVEGRQGGHAAGFLWLTASACATRAEGESGRWLDAERECYLIRSSHVAGCDWLAEFLSI
ncbi:hypothetical protein L195_g058026, partial [Trifolium pratense]